MTYEEMTTMQKLFLCDVDGTLLKTGSPIHPDVIDAVRTFTGNGGRFALATGRPVCAVKELLRILPVNAPCVLCSGSVLYDPEKSCVIEASVMDDSAHEFLRRVLQEHPDVSVTVCTTHEVFNLRKNRCLCEKGVYEDRTAPLIHPDESLALVKVLFSCDDPKQLEEIGEKSQESMLFDYHSASVHFSELTRRGVSKGTAARKLCEKIGKAEVCKLFVAGDAPSDLTMQPFAQRFFAPETAQPVVREKADFVFPDPKTGGLAAVFQYIN